MPCYMSLAINGHAYESMGWTWIQLWCIVVIPVPSLNICKLSIASHLITEPSKMYLVFIRLPLILEQCYFKVSYSLCVQFVYLITHFKRNIWMPRISSWTESVQQCNNFITYILVHTPVFKTVTDFCFPNNKKSAITTGNFITIHLVLVFQNTFL